MKILMNDFTREPAELRQQLVEASRRVFESGYYILGPEVRNFEQQWANFCGVRDSVGVANGMDAIEIGLRALSIGPGDEVITTPMTAFATVLAVMRTGAEPVLADIDPLTGQLDIDSVERCVSPKTKAILLVHLYGQILNPEPFLKLAKDKNIHFIEDCAQAHGAKFNGKIAGTFGGFGAYSFYPTKNLGCIGDGGAIICSDLDFLDRCKILRNYGQSERYHHPVLGMNSRLDELQAALLMPRLNILNEFNRKRKEIAMRYFEGIHNPSMEMLSRPEHIDQHVFHLFVLKSKKRSKIESHLTNNGIQSHIHYPIPVHKQKSMISVKRDPKGLSQVEKYAEECFSIPIHPMLSDDEVNHVIGAVNSFGRGNT